MSDIQLRQGSTLAGSPARQPRWVTKAIGQLNAGADLSLAKIETVAETQAIKVDAVRYVAGKVMHSVTMLSKLETQLALTCPEASGRLALIGDMASFALTDLVQQTAHRVVSL